MKLINDPRSGSGLPLLLLVPTLLILIQVQVASSDCQFIGPGACRGSHWSDGNWPVISGDKTQEECCSACQTHEGCTAFSLGKSKKAKKPCSLFGHQDVQPASSLGGECYKNQSDGKTENKQSEPKEEKPKKSSQEAKKDKQVKQQQPEAATKKSDGAKEQVKQKRPIETPKPEQQQVKADNKKEKAPVKKEAKAESDNKPAAAKESPARGVEKAKQTGTKKPPAQKEATPTPQIYDGKKLVKIGNGGCRGLDWNRKGCPKFIGRVSLEKCAQECRKNSYCTAFHVLKFDATDKTHECLIFGHKEVIAVKQLGGTCYTFHSGEDDDDEEEEKDIELKEPAKMIEIGMGMCRGPGWTFGKWPIEKGHAIPQECADACAKKKGCTAFDLSDKSGKKFACFLYGHQEVEPAAGMKGKCYTYLGNKHTQDLANEEILDELEDQQIDEDDGKPAKVSLIGLGMCRGPNWQSDKWPVDKGTKTRTKCAKACSNRKGCVAFDLSPPDDADDLEDVAKGELQCNLYGHENVVPAPAVKGNCYRLIGAEVVHEEKAAQAEEKKAIIDDGTLDKLPRKDDDYSLIGAGLCRGKDWQRNGIWPKDEGVETFDRCALQCKKDPACTAFDVTPSEKKSQFRCHHFGHDKVAATNSVSLRGRCYRMTGRNAKKLARPKPTFNKRSEKFKSLGSGMCRGDGWQNQVWPKPAGLRTFDECFARCENDQGCTAFEVAPSEKKKKLHCILYGHDNVMTATSNSLLDRKCFKMPGRSAATVVVKKGAKAAVSSVKSIIPTNVDTDEIIDVGPGLCRGPKWQKNNWPKDEGIETFDSCFEECKKLESCTAFDLSPTEVRNKFRCILFGHSDIIPASSTSLQVSNCYKMAGRKAIPGAEPPKPKRNVGASKKKASAKGPGGVSSSSLGHTMIGRGLCRGPNWQRGKWPKDEGIETLESCSKECNKLSGCTAFDLTPTEVKNKFRCILHGHGDIQVADAWSLQSSRCYRMIGRTAAPQDLSEPSTTSRGSYEQDADGKGYVSFGRGLCRGPDWQDEHGIWPKFEGFETLEDCFKECKKDPGCTAFDISPSEVKNKFRCVLHGHGDVVPATSKTLLESRCYRMTGRSDGRGTVPGGIPEDVDGEGFFSLGKGLCRGEGWQDGDWPHNGGFKTVEQCAKDCEQKGGCTSFDTSDYNKRAKKFQCWLHGHKEVAAASDLDGTCYQMSHATEVGDRGPGLLKEGDGACRGTGWQDSRAWPKVKGLKTLMQCGEACAGSNGCTAFDIRKSDKEGVGKKFECTLYGHVDVEAAYGVSDTTCYRVTASFGRPKKAAQTIEEAVASPVPKKKAKTYKVPEFDQPTVQEDDGSNYEEEYLFEPPPKEVRSRAHIDKILGLTGDSVEKGHGEATLKALKRIYENSIQPLESTYKYKELSHRHFGDPEIFTKPLIVLMGPWSGGKSTMVNYFLGNEYNKNAFKTGAEPSAGFNFNIAMHGDRDEELDGTQLAAEFTFSSLQKFGQEFLTKLRGKKMPNKLLKKATFAEIPGLLETGSRRVDRRYPFNDACQWFIDHADLILLVYDYTKLDIGPETEALLDQLKGRESQVRIILNKADEITQDEMLKMQNNLVWNVAPHMASIDPPILYAGSFWSHPYKEGAAKQLLQSQEASLLRDIRGAIDKRVENRIATARRFAVRVRNHAKMVDVYLATFNNQQGMFGNKKATADAVVNTPEKFHIYDGIATMTNISRYDLPDPDSYKTFFGLHPLSEFPTLQSTCTFFKGCPINKMDLAISYELPELLTDYKRKRNAKQK